MQCFLHHDIAAVGICRTCGKGLCPACAREIDRGIVCSDACAEFAIVNHQIVDRAKRVYSIGVKARIPLGTWFFTAAGLFMLSVGAFLAWSDPAGWSAAAYPGGLGALFLVFAVLIWRRYRSIGLNL
jgi:hypothetical protein